MSKGFLPFSQEIAMHIIDILHNLNSLPVPLPLPLPEKVLEGRELLISIVSMLVKMAQKRR